MNQRLLELLKNCRAFQPEILKTKIYEKMLQDIVAINSSKEHNIVAISSSNMKKKWARYGLGILSNALRARRGGGDRTREEGIPAWEEEGRRRPGAGTTAAARRRRVRWERRRPVAGREGG